MELLWIILVSIGCIAIGAISSIITKLKIKIQQRDIDKEYALIEQEKQNQLNILDNDITILQTNREHLNQDIEKLANIIDIKQQNCDELSENINKLTQIQNENNTQIASLTAEKNSLLMHMTELQEQAKTVAQNYYDQTMALANERISTDIDQMEQKYLDSAEECKKAYISCEQDLNEVFQSNLQLKQQELEKISYTIVETKNTLNDLQIKINSIIQTRKLEDMKLNEKDFYRCCITDIDQQEIAKLREIEYYMRDKRPICKIIWESYYRDAGSALLIRLLGNKNKVSGIYKITNLKNNKIYIGQSVNLADRLTNHMKAGVGIDANNNKMYQDMKAIGLENFTFEIIEQCEANKLNTEEKYWIEFYHSQEYGYNSTKGGA